MLHRLGRATAITLPLLAAALLGGCRLDGFRPTERVPEASGPIPPGLGRLRIENIGTREASELWFTPCIGGTPLKVNRRLRPGDETAQDLAPGCTRVTVYWKTGGALFVNVVVVESVVTTQTLS